MDAFLLLSKLQCQGTQHYIACHLLSVHSISNPVSERENLYLNTYFSLVYASLNRASFFLKISQSKFGLNSGLPVILPVS